MADEFWLYKNMHGLHVPFPALDILLLAPPAPVVVQLALVSRVACNAARRVPSAGRMISSSTAARAPAVLPDLTYDYGELEPAISGEIMKIHHTKHHQVGSIFLVAYKEEASMDDARVLLFSIWKVVSGYAFFCTARGQRAKHSVSTLTGGW